MTDDQNQPMPGSGEKMIIRIYVAVSNKHGHLNWVDRKVHGEDTETFNKFYDTLVEHFENHLRGFFEAEDSDGETTLIRGDEALGIVQYWREQIN